MKIWTIHKRPLVDGRINGCTPGERRQLHCQRKKQCDQCWPSGEMWQMQLLNKITGKSNPELYQMKEKDPDGFYKLVLRIKKKLMDTGFKRCRQVEIVVKG